MLKKISLQKKFNYNSFSMAQNSKINDFTFIKTPVGKNQTISIKNYSQNENVPSKVESYFKQNHKRTNFSPLKFDCEEESLNIINLYINGIKDLKQNDTLSYTIKLMKLHSYLEKNGHFYKIVSKKPDLNKYIEQNSIHLLTNDRHVLKNIQIQTLHNIYMLYLFNGLYKFEKLQTFKKTQENSQELKNFLKELINNEKCNSSLNSTKNCAICEIIKEFFNTTIIKNNINNTNNFNNLSCSSSKNKNKNEQTTGKKYKMQTQIINHNKKIQKIKKKLINEFNNKNKTNCTYYSNLDKNLTLSYKKNTAPLANKTKKIIGIKIKNSTIINSTYKEDKEKQQKTKTEPNNSFIKYIKTKQINELNLNKINQNFINFDCHKLKQGSKSNSAEQSTSKKNTSISYNSYCNNKIKSKIFLKKQTLHPNNKNKNNENLGPIKDFISFQKIQRMINGNIFINYNISTIFKDSSKKEYNNKYNYNKVIRKLNSNRNSFMFNTNIKIGNIDKISNNKKIYEINKHHKNNNQRLEANKELKYDDNYFIVNKGSFVKTWNVGNGENQNNNKQMTDINTYANAIENRINYMKEEIDMFKAHNNEIKKQLYNLNNKNNNISS